MAKTANVFARVEPEVKRQAEEILDLLGIPMSSAVEIFLRMVAMHKGIPFDVKIPEGIPVSYGGLTNAQFDYEIQKGMDDVKNGRVFSAEEIEREMEKDFGI